MVTGWTSRMVTGSGADVMPQVRHCRVELRAGAQWRDARELRDVALLRMQGRRMLRFCK